MNLKHINRKNFVVGLWVSEQESEDQLGTGRGDNVEGRNAWRVSWNDNAFQGLYGNQYTGNFLNYMKVILIGCSNNGGDRIPAGHFLLPNESSSTKMALHSMQLLAKVVPQKFPSNPSCCKDNMLLSANFHHFPIAKTTPTQHTELVEVELVPICVFHPTFQCLCCEMVIFRLTKGKSKHQPRHKTFTLQSI